MDTSLRGEAIFSTRLGQFLSREAVEPRGPIVLRSDPEDDLESLSARLEQDFPIHCKGITLPIMDIYEYFDHYDCHVRGTGFLHKVLENIVFRSFTRSQHIQAVVSRWREGKSATFNAATAAQSLHDIFTQIEVEEYGENILEEAFGNIRNLSKLDLDRKVAKAQHRGDAPARNIKHNFTECPTSLPNPSVQPQRNSSAPQISYLVPVTNHLPVQRSSSAIDVSLDAIPKESPNLRSSKPQVVTSGTDGYSNSINNTQVSKQVIPREVAVLSPRALPLPFSYYPTPSGIGISPDALQASVYQPQPNCANPMAKKPPSMGFSNDARNLVNQSTGIIATQVPLIQRAMYMGYQLHPLGAENQHPKDMSGFRPGIGSDRVFSGYPVASSSGGDNFSNQSRHLPNDHPAGVPFNPHTGGRGRDRRFSLHQRQSAFHQPAVASGLGIMSAIMPTMTNSYWHSSTGQLSSQGDMSQGGNHSNHSTPTNFTSATSFPDHQLSRQDSVQRHAHEAQKDFRRFDEKYLYVGLFPNHVTVHELQSIFACCGPIDHVDLPRNSRSPNTRSGCSAYSFIRYVDAGAATEAVKFFHGKSLDFLGGPPNYSLAVQPAGISREYRFSREGGSTQAFSKSNGSSYNQYQRPRRGSRSYHGGDRRRDSLPSQLTEMPRATVDVDQENLAKSTNQPVTAPTEENIEMPPQIDSGLSQLEITPREVSIKLPPSENLERARQEFPDLKLDDRDKSTMTNLPPNVDSRPEAADQEYSGNTGFAAVSEDAGKKRKSPIKPKAGNKATVPRGIKDEELKRATGKTDTTRFKSTLAQVGKRSEKPAYPKSEEKEPIQFQAAKRPENSAGSQTPEKKPTPACSQESPEGYVKPRRDGRKPTPVQSGKKCERPINPKAEGRIEELKVSHKPSSTDPGLVHTAAPTTTLKPTLSPEGSASLIPRDNEAHPIKAGLESLAAFIDPVDTGRKKEGATTEQQDRPVSLSMTRADSGSTKTSGCGGPSLITAEPTTHAHSEQSDTSELESQVPVASLTAKGLPPKPLHNFTKPNMIPVSKAATSGSFGLETLGTAAERLEYVNESKKPSVAPMPSARATSLPSAVPASQRLGLPIQTSRDLSHDSSDLETTTVKQHSLGATSCGSKAIAGSPLSASIVKTIDGSLTTPVKATSTVSDKIGSSILADVPKTPEMKYGPEIPARSSSLVTPATPVLTHMKKQRNLKSPRIATENPHVALVPEIPDTSTKDKLTSKAKELPQNGLANHLAEGSDQAKSLEQDSSGRVDILHAQRRKDIASASIDKIRKAIESVQDQQISPGERRTESSASESQPGVSALPNNHKQDHKTTTSKSRKKSKSKGSKGSTTSEPAAGEPTWSAAASIPRTTLPEPETPFVTDNIFQFPQRKSTDRLSTEDSSRSQDEYNELRGRFSAEVDEYYSMKAQEYTPQLRRAMRHDDSATTIVSSDIPSDNPAPRRTKIFETPLDVENQARRSGYLARRKDSHDTSTGNPSYVVSLRQALDAFEAYGIRKTSDSDEDSPSTLGGPDEFDAFRVQNQGQQLLETGVEPFTSKNPFLKPMAEVDTGLHKKPKPAELSLPLRRQPDLERLPNQEEVLSQMNPKVQKVFLNLQSNPASPAASQPSTPVTPTRLQHSMTQVILPQHMANLEKLNAPERRQAAAKHVQEHGSHLKDIANKMINFGAQERREVAMLQAQFSGTSLPLSEVNASITRSPSKEDLHKVAEEMSKLTTDSRDIVIKMITKEVTPLASPSQQQSFTFSSSPQQPPPSWSPGTGPLPVPPPAPPPAPRMSHRKLPSYSEAMASSPMQPAQPKSPPSDRPANPIPSLTGTTLEVTEIGLGLSMETLTSSLLNTDPQQQRPQRQQPQQVRPYRTTSTGAYRELSNPSSVTTIGRSRRRAATEEGPEREVIERRNREKWGVVAHQEAHNEAVDPWGVPRGEKAWGSGSRR